MSWTKNHLGTSLIYITCLTPILLWFIYGIPEQKFGNQFLTLTSFGQLFGLLGFTLFSISLFLSARLKVFENFFPGLNRVYVVHHKVGMLSLILLILHAIFVSLAYLAFSPLESLKMFIPSTNWQLNLGLAGLSILIGLIVITIYTKLPYQIWLLTHKFLGLSYLLGSLHSLFIPSDISRTPILKIYSLILIIICLLFYTFRTVLGKWLVPRYKYTIRNVTELLNHCIEIELDPTNKVLNFSPGQFIFITILSEGIKRETHPFSISSAPASSLKLTIRSLGDWTRKVLSIKPGATVLIEGPFGAFSYSQSGNHNQVWIAGGIGITPFLSMARSITSPNFNIDLYYSVKDENEEIYAKEFLEITVSHPNFKFIPFYSTTMGRLSATKINENTPNFSNRDFFICGPPPMMHSLREQLRKAGIKNSHIHTEEFNMN